MKRKLIIATLLAIAVGVVLPLNLIVDVLLLAVLFVVVSFVTFSVFGIVTKLLGFKPTSADDFHEHQRRTTLDPSGNHPLSLFRDDD